MTKTTQKPSQKRAYVQPTFQKREQLDTVVEGPGIVLTTGPRE
jgi:hypothetical protein